LTANFLVNGIRWYDCVESDQREYELVLAAVASDLRRKGTLERDTFIRILNSKAARVKGKIGPNYSVYAQEVSRAHRMQDPIKRIGVLVDLEGIGVPVASTILHFMDLTKSQSTTFGPSKCCTMPVT
jgi:hypothetical protein